MSLYLHNLQVGGSAELFVMLKNEHVCVTKRMKLQQNGLVCPRFLREVAILKQLTFPPKHLEDHPGRDHVIKILNVDSGTEDVEYVHIDIECADGTLYDLVQTMDVKKIKEKVLIDISKGLQYVHANGFNHGDLSLRNIAYFKDGVGSYRFKLIDFGNAFHADRPYTLETSTYYTMPLEMIEANRIMSVINSRIQDLVLFDDLLLNNPSIDEIKSESISVNTNVSKLQHINDILTELRKTIIHKKSDIWSLGALSYFLHTYELYAHGDSIDQQKEMIERRLTMEDTVIEGNSGFVEKTKLMLMSDHSVRPELYFVDLIPESKDIQDKPQDKPQAKPHDQDIVDIKDSIGITYSSYSTSIICTIDGVCRANNKYHFIKLVDDGTLIKMTRHSHSIESVVMDKISNYIRSMPNHIVINTTYFIRTIIIWVVSHLYMNSVWTVNEIANYAYGTQIVASRNHDVQDLVKKTGIMILDEISWNIEKFIQVEPSGLV